MTIINTAIVIISYSTFSVLIYYLRRDTPRFSRIKTIAFGTLLGSLFAALYPVWEMYFGGSLKSVDLYILLEFVITAPPAFFIYPKKPNKNLFFISTTTPLMVVGHGLGNLTELSFAPNELIGRILNLIIMTACFIIILSGLFWLTRKKFPGLFENENPKLWRRLWIITLLLGFTQIVAGNVFSGSTFTAAGIIPSRLISLVGMAAIFYIAGLAKVQAEESAIALARAEAARETTTAKEKAYSAIVAQTEETSRLRHDRRQMFAAIGGLNEPGKETELESYCLEVLAELQTDNIQNHTKTELAV
jgi:hypothetical protein